MRSVNHPSHHSESSERGRIVNNEARSSREKKTALPERTAVSQPQWHPLQQAVGNRTAQRMMGTSLQADPPVQRMTDPDGKNADMLAAMYRGIYGSIDKTTRSLLGLPKPSDMKRLYASMIKQATDLNDALNRLADHVVDKYLMHLNDSEQNKWRKKMMAYGRTAKTKAEQYEERKKRDLDELNKDSGEDKTSEQMHPRKRFKYDRTQDDDFFGKKEHLDAVLQVLADKEKRLRIMSASKSAHERVAKMSRNSVPMRAQYNELEQEKPMGIAELLSVQEHYTKERTGDALLLEKGEDYQVTMGRGGGREVHQLGPYQSGSSNSTHVSVDEMTQKLMEGGFSSVELAKAVETRDPEQVRGMHEFKGNEYRDVRALRHLYAIERARGPEVAISTTMMHRMSELAMLHYSDYVKDHPLAPPDATADLRKARDKAEANEEEGTGYVPHYIQTRAFQGLEKLAQKSFEKKQDHDPSIGMLLREIHNLGDGEEEKDDRLTESMMVAMLTPPHLWSKEGYELENRYTSLFQGLGGKMLLDEWGTNIPLLRESPNDIFGRSISVPELPVKGLPNRTGDAERSKRTSISDCFINAVVQLMAEPYADFFDTGKHELRNDAKREVQIKVGNAIRMIEGVDPKDNDAIFELRVKLLAAGMVQGIEGHEDASELMLHLLRAVTNLEGMTIQLPAPNIGPYTMKKDETLADVAKRFGCDLNELQQRNRLLDTSKIVLRTKTIRTLYEYETSDVMDPDSVAYTGGKIESNAESGPGFVPIDIEDFSSFDDYLKYTFGEGAMLTTLSQDNLLRATNDGVPLLVSSYANQRRMLRIPDVMTFYLKRFKMTDSGLQEKIEKDFPMPETIQLIEHEEGAPKLKSFRLIGVARHTGELAAGHYTANVSRGDQWYHANDERVTERTEEDVRNTVTEGYIYSYRLTGTTELNADAREGTGE